jgi:radical SAM superfamily enzyme YgiQ (UPF0313 family)
MKVLMVNPEFPFSFWSYQEACKFLGAKALVAPLGLITVAGLLPQDWELRLCDLNTAKINEADWDWADMVMISAMFVQRDGILALIKEAKERGKSVVVGGAYPTTMPDEVIDAGCDFLIVGEAEQSILPFLSALKQGELNGVFRSTQRPDMSSSPVPRFDLLKFEDYGCIAIQTSRGCPYNCEFCEIINLYGRKPRNKTPNQVIKELEAIYRLGWRGMVFICDDNFIGNKNYAKSILQKLIPWMKGHGEPFSFNTQASFNLGQDLEMIDLMTEANFREVFIGVETPDEEILALIHKNQNIGSPLIESLNNINRNGLSVMGSFIIGFDGEKSGAGDRICTFVDRTNIRGVMLNILQAVPNTQLWDRLKAEGRLREEMMRCVGVEVFQNFIPMRPAGEIIEEYVQALSYLYEPSRYLARCYNSVLSMRPTRAALAAQRGDPPPAACSPRNKLPWKRQLWDFLGLLRLIWRQGIRASYRRQFWSQLINIKRKNPSRLTKYLFFCFEGEDVFQLRKIVLKWAHATRKSQDTNYTI